MRAFLSNRYRPLDNAALAEAVLPVLQELGIVLTSCEITERRMYLKGFDQSISQVIEIDGKDHFVAKKKDTCYPAIAISNSEVGHGSLSVAGGVFTDGCTNFAIFNSEGVRKYHMGSKLSQGDEVYNLLTL